MRISQIHLPSAVNPNPIRIAVLCFSALWISLLGACAHQASVPPAQGHITGDTVSPIPANIPPPTKITSFVPPPKRAAKIQTYSVVVNEVPVKELLFALARDTKQNIDIHPNLQGLVSLNAIDETLPAILDRIAHQVNLRYRTEGNTLIVTPDIPYLKTYKVNYVNMSRNATSTVGVSGQISSTSSVSGNSSNNNTSNIATITGGSGNSSNTSVNSVSNNNFWEVLKDNIRGILSSTRALNQSAEDRAARAESARASREERMQQAEAVARAGASAPTLFKEVFGNVQPLQQVELKEDIIVNPVTGTVSVFGTDRQHHLVQQYLDGVMSSAQRQVLIEATIAEVRLSDAYKAGVDWSRLAVHGGLNITQSLLAGNLGTAPNLTIGYTNTTSRLGNISGAIRLLEQFGNTKVLSSPKLMALNNQTALLKVVDNIVYFSVEAQQQLAVATGVAATTRPAFTTTAHTVSVGVVMSVTPQINENGAVTLTVRPTISRVLRFKNDPNPALSDASLSAPVINPVPEIQVREMESVLQVNSGQTVILGGLMQDDIVRNRDAIPVLGELPHVGDLFSYRDESAAKTELVIFLRPTVITNPSLESDELKFYKRFLPSSASNTTKP